MATGGCGLTDIQTADFTAQTFADALASHRRGARSEAEALYERVLAVSPRHLEALRCLGILLCQQGRLEEGANRFRTYIDSTDRPDGVLIDLGRAEQALGRPAEALAHFTRALEAQPSLPSAWVLIADAQQALGQHEQALAACDRALQLGAVHPNVLNLSGISLAALGRGPEALVAFERALSQNASDPLALNNRGNVLAQLERHEEAIASFDAALTLSPQFPEALTNRGASLEALHRSEEALQCHDRALALRPAYFEALLNRGIVLGSLHRNEEAIASLTESLRLRRTPEALNNLGNVLVALGRDEAALANYEEALDLRPTYAHALVHRGLILTRSGRLVEAAAALTRALELDPSFPYAAGARLEVAMRSCDWAGLEGRIEAAVSAVIANRRAILPLAFLGISDSPEDQKRCADIWMQDRIEPVRERLSDGPRRTGSRLRIAYLSPDFRSHPVAALSAGLFEKHDRRRFETTAIAFGPRGEGDPMRARLERAFDRFVDVTALSDRDAALLLREHEIDIAVDLAGLTLHARPGILAYRPAPVQVSYLGYPGTLGATHIDYVVADRTVIPPAHEHHYAERVVRLPDSFLVTDDTQPIAPTPSRASAGLADGTIVYCNFGGSHKLSPVVFDNWMRILGQVESAVLWLSLPPVDAAVHLRNEAARRGIDPARVLFAQPAPAREQHLARLQLADLFLDTLPYNAHSTAVDALWAGLPVLTCAGNSFAGRVAASLLQAVGLPELITPTLPDYEALAVELGLHSARRRAFADRLLALRGSSRLFDTYRCTRNLERAYLIMWERYEKGEAPVAFNIETY